MKKIMTAIVLSSVLSLMISSFAYSKEKEKDKTYSYKNYEFSYPKGWAIIHDADSKGDRMVKVSQSKEALTLALTFFENVTPEDIKKEKFTPALLATAYCMPQAQHLADNNNAAISLSYGNIGLSTSRVLSTRVTVALPNIPDVYNLECFASSTTGKVFVGMLLSNSRKGLVLEPKDSASYRKAYLEAYHIIKSIAIKGKDGKVIEPPTVSDDQ